MEINTNKWKLNQDFHSENICQYKWENKVKKLIKNGNKNHIKCIKHGGSGMAHRGAISGHALRLKRKVHSH